MPDPDPSQTPSSEKASGAGEPGQPKPEGSAPDSGAQHAPGQEPSQGGDAQFVTPSILQGVVNAQKRTFQEELSKLRAGVATEIQQAIVKAVTEARVASPVPDEAGKKGHEKPENPEVIELRRKHDTLLSDVQRLREELDSAKKEKRQFRFETIVRDALSKNGCNKPDLLLPFITPRLQFDEAKGRVFATVEGQYGLEELTVEDFVKRVARDEIAPELFKPATRPGSPAGGDDGSGGARSYLFTAEQIADPKFYRENVDKIHDALDKGLVKGISKGGK